MLTSQSSTRRCLFHEINTNLLTPPDYDPEVLKNATKAAGQNPNIGTIVYDSIYNCQANGVIAWNRHCDNGCNAAQEVPNANCRA